MYDNGRSGAILSAVDIWASLRALTAAVPQTTVRNVYTHTLLSYMRTVNDDSTCSSEWSDES
jgi:hypothetical protein